MNPARKRWLLLLALASCGDARPIGPEEGTRLTPGAAEVALGVAFPLEVVSVWRKGKPPAAWDAGPLAVKLIESTRREDGVRVEETSRYDAYAFSLTDLDGLRVKTALDPVAPGPPELPERGTSFPWWTLGVAAALLLLLLLLRRPKLGSMPVEAEPAPRPGPEVAALERLARLRGTREVHVAAAELLRDYVGARFCLPARRMTTEEHTPRVAALLRPCDLVKFARGPAGDSGGLLDAMESYIKETA